MDTTSSDLSHIPNVQQVKSTASHLQPGISKATVDRIVDGLPEDLKPFRMRPTKKNRLVWEDAEILQIWFDRFRTATDGVAPENIYNFDETTFQIGRGNRPQWAFAFSGELPIADNGERTWSEWITTIECLAADGWAMDPYMIIQGDQIPEKWPQTKRCPASTVFINNQSGRITEDVSLEWIKFFDRQTKDRAVDGQSRILLFRGEPLHLTFAFLEFCDQNNIIPFTFPLKMGHLMQPFNTKHFNSYNEYWKRKICYVKPKTADEEKDYFIKNFFPDRVDWFKRDNVKDAFAKQGIYPCDPSKIIDSLK